MQADVTTLRTVLDPLRMLTACAVAIATLGGCATNPVSGRPEVVLSSREDEVELGREAAEQVRSHMGLMPDDSPRVLYVQKLGADLAKHSPRQDIEYQFQIVDMAEPNAFALPGGYIYVSRGLLLLANDEAALAGAVGHEIGHAAARHSVQRQTRAAPLAILSGVTSGLVGIVSPRLGAGVGAVTGLANSAVLAPYGRSQEREADRVGQEIAAQAGYAPDGITQILDSLGREQKLEGGEPSGFSFLATHPSSEERVADTREHAASLERASVPTLSPTQKAFYDRLDGLVVGERASGGVFVDEVQFLHPDLDFRLRFPDGWKVQNGSNFVGAVTSEGDAAVVLQLAPPNDDPVAAGRAYMSEKGLRLSDPVPLEVNGLPAARVIGAQDRRGVVLTWINSGGNTFQITAVGPESRFGALQPIFVTSSDSFARLAAADRAKITEKRVRIFAANGSESLEALVERVGGEDSVEFIAVVNGIDGVDHPLERGRLVKVPIRERYVSAPDS